MLIIRGDLLMLIIRGDLLMLKVDLSKSRPVAIDLLMFRIND